MRNHLPWQSKLADTEIGNGISVFWDTLFVALVSAFCISIGVTFLLFALGVPLTRLSGLVYIISFLLIVWSRSVSLKNGIWKILVFSVLIHLGALAFCSFFYDLGGDGMATHQEAVIILNCEWNPIKDPFFLEYSKLAEKYEEIATGFYNHRGIARTFTYVGGAMFSKFTGFHESSKFIHTLGAFMAFCGAMSLGSRLFRKKANQWIFALLISLNPVFCYQFLSFWQDGFLAGIYSSLLVAGCLWILEPRSKLFLFLFVSLGFILSGMKLAGVGFAGLTSAVVYAVVWYRRGFRLGWFIPVGVLNVLAIGLAGVLAGNWPFQYKWVAPIKNKIEIYRSDEVNGGGNTYNQVEEYFEENRWVVFFSSAFSKSRSVAREVELKNPFSTSWDELRTFYYFFEDPRSGGYGVFYGAMCLTGGLLFILGLFYNWRACAISILFVFTILLPLEFVPTYWARWIPQMWFLPLLLALPIWLYVDQQSEVAEEQPKLFSLKNVLSMRALISGFLALGVLNLVLIFFPYVCGNVFGTYILNQQLNLVKELPVPLLWGNGSYPSNRKWFIDHDIDFQVTWDSEHWRWSYIKPYRTDTRIFLNESILKYVLKDGHTVEEKLDKMKESVQRWQKHQWHNEIWVDNRKPQSKDNG